MPGEGSLSKIGIAYEPTPGTPVVPDSTIPFVSADIVPNQDLILGESIGGDGMAQGAEGGVKAVSGNVVQEFDAETSLDFIFFGNTVGGYTAQGALTTGIITGAPTGSAGGTGGVLATGNWKYQVQLILMWTLPNQKVMTAKSALSANIAVTLGEKATIGWTIPGSLPPGMTVFGTAIFRSEVGGDGTTTRYIGFVTGSTNSFVDDGVTTAGESNQYADRNVLPVPTTSIYGHLFKGATPPTNAPRLRSFTMQLSKNVGSDEYITGSQVGGMTIEVSGANDRVKSTFTLAGLGLALTDDEFSAEAPAIRRLIVGHRTTAVINDVVRCEVQSFTWSCQNTLVPQYGLCNNDSAQSLASSGNRVVSGTMTMRFQDRDLQAKSLLGEEVKLQLLLYGEPVLANGGTLNKVRHGVDAIPFPRIAILTMDRCKITFQAPIANGGQIIAAVNYTAWKSLTTLTDFSIQAYNLISTYLPS